MSLENPSPSRGQESEHSESIPGIEKAKGFDELFEALRALGGLWGSDGTRYSSEDLEDSIRHVREGQSRLKSITRTGGLREKVAALLIEKKESDEASLMPKVGDLVVLTKISQFADQQPMASGEEKIEGVLTQEIILGKPILLGAGRHTSSVQAMRKGEKGFVVETENSTYLLERK